MKVKLNSSTSVKSVNENIITDIELRQNNSFLPELKNVDSVNLYDVFLNERKKSNKYRFIITLNGIFSNVLFNVFTEIVKNEGGNNVIFADNDDLKESINDAIGYKNPTRLRMIRDTEYSNDKNNFSYLCGFDIFNNHLLRNNTFKVVNILNESDRNKEDDNQYGSPKMLEIFNTIRDVMRHNDGSDVLYNKRVNVSDSPKTKLKKHLYEYDNITNITDSINNGLIEENGWFGFTNGMSIKDLGNDKGYKFNMVINNKKQCEFIDMYPDRTLFSFNPKRNNIRKRLEYNWKFIITYPYSKNYNHYLISNQRDGENNINGIYVYSCESKIAYDGSNVLLFRTKCKNGLNINDSISIFAEMEDGTIYKMPDFYTIKNVGDIEGKNKKYYFYVLNNGILENIFGEDYKNIANINEELKKVKFRFKHVINGFESEYYIRMFKKLPNFKCSREELTENIGKNRNKFNSFVRKNAVDDKGNMINFDSQIYKLGFESNIYTDECSQITFTDTIDITNIYDHNGMPLSEVYLTIIKNNKGWDKWYNDNERNDEEVEFSHCFGKITSGFNLFSLKSDLFDYDKRTEDLLLSDVHKLHNVKNYYEPSSYFLEDNINENGSDSWYYGESEENVFYGDLVEFNKSQVKEYILEDVFHRFNTNQRETDKLSDWYFCFDEITSDDYDSSIFTVKENNIYQYDGISVNQRPEGYFYKPHYKIQLKEISNTINQDSIETINPKRITKIEEEREVAITCYTNHNLNSYSKLEIVNKINNNSDFVIVNSTTNSKTFLITVPSSYEVEEFIDLIFNNNIIILKLNDNIPDYATSIDDGSYRYLWRNVQSVGDINNVELEEYPFTNDCFYIHKQINLFLRRQDPENKVGLYTNNFPNDIYGNIDTEKDNYYYSNESESIC